MLTSSPGTVVARMCAMPLKTWTANEAQARFAEMTADAQAIPQIVALSEDRKKHTSELQSLMRISYAVFCLKKKKPTKTMIITCKRITHTHKHSNRATACN